MNKAFLAVLVFGFAVAAAQPTQPQCAVNNDLLERMGNLASRAAKGEGKYKTYHKKPTSRPPPSCSDG